MAESTQKVHPRMRVGELAERTGKTVRALRFYEEMDLLRPVERTKGGFRQYDDQALIRIQWIDRLQELGFSLRETREFLAALQELPTGPAAMAELRSFYAQKLDQTREQMQRLSRLETELEESLDFLESCQGCNPVTPRKACVCCDDAAHLDFPAPVLVAAVQERPVKSKA
jgi:DNA-binding transcriptional MerR regulator